MRIRDYIFALSIPILFVIFLYYYAKEPDIYSPPLTMHKLKSGQSLTIVFFGDSITAGYGVDSSYVYLFRLRLKSTSAFDRTKVVNAGVPGNTAADGLARLDSDVLSQKPDLVYLAFGGNDLKARVPLSEFENILRKMVRRLQSETHSEVIMLTTPVFDIPLISKTTRQYNDVIRKVAKEENVGLLDINKTWKKAIGWRGSAGDYMQDDHIHPNNKGYHLIYVEICRTLEF